MLLEKVSSASFRIKTVSKRDLNNNFNSQIH
jgi:hypothetical protein